MSRFEAPASAERLLGEIRKLPDALIAFSGGVDSAVVAKGAFLALGDRAVAITGIGPAVASSELEDARRVAVAIGIRHVELPTSEIEDPAYLRNDARRCYHCKSNLYGSLRRWADAHGWKTLLSGTNRDDLGDYRPGLDAARENQVISPLADLGFGKEEVRGLAEHFGLSIADKPASPCLASRIAYGQAVSPERLQQIESAEECLRRAGFRDVRVRFHADGIARLEIHQTDWPKLMDDEIRSEICRRLQELGFKYVTMDLMARQPGSLNRMLPVV